MAVAFNWPFSHLEQFYFYRLQAKLGFGKKKKNENKPCETLCEALRKFDGPLRDLPEEFKRDVSEVFKWGVSDSEIPKIQMRTFSESFRRVQKFFINFRSSKVFRKFWFDQSKAWRLLEDDRETVLKSFKLKKRECQECYRYIFIRKDEPSKSCEVALLSVRDKRRKFIIYIYGFKLN